MSDTTRRAVDIFMTLHSMTRAERDSIFESLHEGRRKNLMHAEALRAIQYAFEEFIAKATAHSQLLEALELAFPKGKATV